jgi:hypothetical protein
VIELIDLDWESPELSAAHQDLTRLEVELGRAPAAIARCSV